MAQEKGVAVSATLYKQNLFRIGASNYWVLVWRVAIVLGGSIIGKTFSQELYTTHVGIKHPRIRGERLVHNLYLRTKRRTAGSRWLVGLWARPGVPRELDTRRTPSLHIALWQWGVGCTGQACTPSASFARQQTYEIGKVFQTVSIRSFCSWSKSR